jgi:hypothetical protein
LRESLVVLIARCQPSVNILRELLRDLILPTLTHVSDQFRSSTSEFMAGSAQHVKNAHDIHTHMDVVLSTKLARATPLRAIERRPSRAFIILGPPYIPPLV